MIEGKNPKDVRNKCPYNLRDNIVGMPDQIQIFSQYFLNEKEINSKERTLVFVGMLGFITDKRKSVSKCMDNWESPE